MRIAVTPIRVAFLFVNLGLIGFLAYSAFAGYKGDDLKAPETSVQPIAKFRYDENEGGPVRRSNSGRELASSAQKFMPQKRVDTPITTPPVEEKQPEPETEEELAEGPLGKEWEFVHYIAFHKNTLRNRATLAKKKDDNTKKTGLTADARSRLRNRGRTSSRSSARKPVNKRATDRFDFEVRQRHIKLEEENVNVDFYVHSVDSEKMVYWMPGRPKTMYALKYSPPGGEYGIVNVIRDPSIPLVIGFKDPDAEEDEDEDKGKFLIRRPDRDYEAELEAEYQKKLGGASSNSKTSAGRTSKSGIQKRPIKAGRPSTKIGGTEPSREKSKEEQMAELKATLSDPKVKAGIQKELKNLPAKDRAALKELLGK